MRTTLASQILGLLGVAVARFNQGHGRPTPTRHRRYVDKAGMPHGNSGDKLRRKMMTGTVGLTKRGPYAAWHLNQPKTRRN